ncbi:hypothetical protein ABZ192_12610 [Streptomyces sp. NPDC006235]|uniref:hypothetical protein n=1 Tax=Streptomyces sp. NPDC006235 TaxID=3156736 RepID=UPI0033AB2907
MSHYAEGDKVSYKGMEMPATVISGPYPTHGAARWLICKADNTVTLARESELAPIRDQRERVAAAAYRAATDQTWPPALWGTRSKYLRVADAAIAELEKPTAKRPLRAGDRIRILRAGLEFAEVKHGEVLSVLDVVGDSLHAKTNKLERGYYIFSLAGEGAGWERV